jgi:eukaryotic-like serine/threonine-protein kinase
MLVADALITLDGGLYRLREPLAGSAYGVVWRAQPLSGMPDVALKLINRAQMDRAAPLQRARWIASAHNEIAFLSALAPWDERHIVRLLDSGTHEGLPVLALELMEADLGRHLAAERSAGRAIPFGQVLDWMEQVNQALAKVHQYGWQYLDLKPANLLLGRHGAVKLADFGTNRPSADGPSAHYAGTANWQAPEQFFPAPGGHYATSIRTDYFALGAMFYFLVTGGHPLRFCSDCGHAYREHQADAAPRLLERHQGQLPATLRAEEAALFAHRIESQFRHARDATWRPAADSGAAAAALALLRILLAPDPGNRPVHAVQISRMLSRARTALPAAPHMIAPRMQAGQVPATRMAL